MTSFDELMAEHNERVFTAMFGSPAASARNRQVPGPEGHNPPQAGLQLGFHREAEVTTLSEDFADWLNSGTRESYYARGLCCIEVTRDALLAAYSAGYSKAVDEVAKGFDEITTKAGS